jgi:serine/threonine-protein kinase HipA
MVNTAVVKLYGKTVGAVVWNPDQQLAFFEYDKGFDVLALPISPIRMPSKMVYGFPELRNSNTFRGLPGLLADVLPDRYGNELINIWLAQNGRSENDLNPVELLCFIGKRGMGALEFEPSISQQNTSVSLELTDLIHYTKQLLLGKEQIKVHTSKEMRDVLLDVLKMGTSAGGARPKAVIAYNEKTGEIRSGQSLPGDGFEHWLIKFDGVNDTQFGETFGYGRVEMAYYQMAIDLGINMMESRIVEENGRAHFLTKRFDRVNGNKKVHVQTFCALQHFDFNRTTSFSYEQLFMTMRSLKLSYAEAEQQFLRMLFNVFGRNCDDHTKNFAFIMDETGKWHLAPAYDLCHAYRPESEWVSQHNLSINGKRKDFALRDFVDFARLNSIRKPEATIEKVLKVVSCWMEYAAKFKVEERLAKVIDNTLIKDIK